MAWIRVIDETEAEGELAEQYQRLVPGGRKVDHILTIHSLHPRTLDDHYRLYRTLMFGTGPLSRREREMVAVSVSAANACHY